MDRFIKLAKNVVVDLGVKLGVVKFGADVAALVAKVHEYMAEPIMYPHGAILVPFTSRSTRPNCRGSWQTQRPLSAPSHLGDAPAITAHQRGRQAAAWQRG